MKILRAHFRAALCVALYACATTAHAQTIHTVTVGNNFFSPANLTIQVGDTVRWINAADGGPVHNVTGDTWGSPQTAESFTYSRVFDEEGVEDYLCTIHPGSMQGTITVEGDGGGTTADLVLEEISVNNDINYQPGGELTIEAEITNSGSETSPAYSVVFFASTDSNITAADTALGSTNRNALGVGNDDNFSVNVNLPQGLAPGNYFIGGIIDIDDADNGNNTNFEDEPISVQDAFVINSGLNDSWFNADTAGQGFFITVFPDIGSIFLAWFTYETERPAESVTANLGEPGHRWLTAFGNYAGNLAVLDVELTVGGIFNSDEPAPVQSADGTIEIEFIDCNSAIIRYDITSAGVIGEIPISRIAIDNVPLCQAAQPQ